MGILYICGALAAGEFAAAQIPTFAEAWPVAAIAALLVALFGYGLSVRAWSCVFLFLLGAALYLQASVAGERLYRERPWLRNRRPRPPAAETVGVRGTMHRDFARRVACGIEHDPETVALNRAILLGERARLPWRMRQTFVESGTMHVFAISGLHVMAVAEVLTVLLSLLLVPRRLVGAFAAPLLWGYVALIGFSPSAVRAALMATFALLAPLAWRRPDGLRAWALTFLAVHLANPLMIVNVGCALSFAVMLAIVLAGGYGQELGGWRARLWMTCAAWAVGVPISAHVFGRVTPGGILANLVLIHAAEFTVKAGAAGLLLSYVSEGLAAHLNNFAALFTRAMVGVSAAVSRLPGANLEVGRWTLLQCAEWYALLALVVVLVRLRRARSPFGWACRGGSMLA